MQPWLHERASVLRYTYIACLLVTVCRNVTQGVSGMTFMVFCIASYVYANVRLGNTKEIIVFFFLK
jgi:hypothetical protein